MQYFIKTNEPTHWMEFEICSTTSFSPNTVKEKLFDVSQKAMAYNKSVIESKQYTYYQPSFHKMLSYWGSPLDQISKFKNFL